ncbi:MAG TPA: hypothetical protein VJ937_07205 [Salinivirga sp.]|nr:hypothetical protein [Salinivirga sp.]HKK59248.1 hypothetical protein [Salinivirga sp.]
MDRKAIFDLYCENQKGEKFIVELQMDISVILTPHFGHIDPPLQH